MKIRPKNGIVILEVNFGDKESVQKYEREMLFLERIGYKSIYGRWTKEPEIAIIHYSK